MVKRDELCAIDPDNAKYYKANAKEYIEEIKALDNDFEKWLDAANTGVENKIRAHTQVNNDKVILLVFIIAPFIT